MRPPAVARGPSRAVPGALLTFLVVATAATSRAEGPNAFNRLHTPPGDRNAPPTADSIHDPAIGGTQILQTPREAFDGLPQAAGGNHVNWSEALKSGKIAPRYSRDDPAAQPQLLDTDVVREVKGTMPAAVFPHQAHTEWLDCANCHPAIFETANGANTMSMAEIMVGQKCGICHGTVAFPVAECRRCHYDPEAAAKASKGTGVARTAERGARKGSRLPWQR